MNDDDALRRQLFVSAVLGLWDKGMDTNQIAHTLREPQALVERALHEGLEMQKQILKDKKG